MRIPNVLAYSILLIALLAIARMTSLGLDRTPRSLPCAREACKRDVVVPLGRPPRSAQHRLVPIVLDGRSLSFLLDTGAESSVIARTTAERMGVIGSARTVLGAVNGEFAFQSVMHVDRLAVGDRAFGDFDLAILDMRGIHEGLGPGVDGVLGADMLSRQPFEIDFVRDRLRLEAEAEADAAGGPIEARAGETIAPLEAVDGAWFVNARADDRVAPFLIDTGSNVSQITESLARALGPATVSRGRSLDSAGSTGESLRTIRLRVLEVGSFARHGFEVTIGDPPVLGTDFFSGLVLRIDPARAQLSLRDALHEEPPEGARRRQLGFCPFASHTERSDAPARTAADMASFRFPLP